MVAEYTGEVLGIHPNRVQNVAAKVQGMIDNIAGPGQGRIRLIVLDSGNAVKVIMSGIEHDQAEKLMRDHIAPALKRPE